MVFFGIEIKRMWIFVDDQHGPEELMMSRPFRASLFVFVRPEVFDRRKEPEGGGDLCEDPSVG